MNFKHIIFCIFLLINLQIFLARKKHKKPVDDDDDDDDEDDDDNADLPPPRNGLWLIINDWNTCSLSCGGGIQTQQRYCIPPEKGGIDCVGDPIITRPCNIDPCYMMTQKQLKDEENIKIKLREIERIQLEEANELAKSKKKDDKNKVSQTEEQQEQQEEENDY